MYLGGFEGSDPSKACPHAFRTDGGSEAEGELRVFAHPLGCPRWGERHRRLHVAHAVQIADELLDLLGDLGADRATGARQRVGDADDSASSTSIS